MLYDACFDKGNQRNVPYLRELILEHLSKPLLICMKQQI